MIEFGKRNRKETTQKEGIGGMNGMGLLSLYFMQGLQQHIARAQEIDQQQERTHDDSKRLDDIVIAIQKEINRISNSDIGKNVSRDDVIKYVRTKILPKDV